MCHGIGQEQGSAAGSGLQLPTTGREERSGFCGCRADVLTCMSIYLLEELGGGVSGGFEIVLWCAGIGWGGGAWDGIGKGLEDCWFGQEGCICVVDRGEYGWLGVHVGSGRDTGDARFTDAKWR